MPLNSIQGRLSAIAFCFIVGTSVAVGLAGFNLTVNFENERFQDHFSLLATYLARNAEVGVLLGNEKILESLAENMLAVRDVQVVEIRDPQGVEIIRRAHDKVPYDLGSVSVPVLSEPMGPRESPFLSVGEGAQEVLGEVKLFYSYAGLSELKRSLARRFVIISLLLGMAPVVMYWMLSRAINAPLHGILSVARLVSKGRMDVRAQGGTLHETKTLARAINEMLDALGQQRQKLEEAHAAIARQQVLAEVGKFSMIVAHEIKNPLAIIKGSLDILKKDGPVAPEMKGRLMGFLDEEIERINRLIENFLLFARPQAVHLRLVPVGDMVESLSHRIRLIDSGINVAVEFSDNEKRFEVSCDPSLLERALFNVIRNALEASGKSDEILVKIHFQGGRLQFVVQDGGSGILPDNLSSIFEPFYSTKAKGTGLGLAIAKDIVTAHGGEISVANGETAGACFTISLPMV